MSLREQILRGGTYLALYQALRLVIAGPGTLLLTRIIGPGTFGTYAAASDIFNFALINSLWGLDVFLLRKESDVTEEEWHQVSSLLLLWSALAVSLAILSMPYLGKWVRIGEFKEVATVIFLALPFGLLRFVPMAKLERALDYRTVAIVELSGLIGYYGVALPLAWRGFGVWAPTAGFWTLQLVTFLLYYITARYKPKWHWDLSLIRSMLGYGLGYSSSEFLSRLRTLVNPLIVGRYLGATSVGYVALCFRLCGALSMVKDVAWRISIPGLARLQSSKERFTRAVSEGMSLQAMAVGPFLVAFSLASPWLIANFFGSAWLPVLSIFPFIALSYLTNAVFSMHSSALYILRRNWGMALFSAVNVGMLAILAFGFVRWVGVRGYGWAEACALAALYLLHYFFTRWIGRPNYSDAAVWYIAWATPLFTWQLGPWVCLLMLLPFVLPRTRKHAFQILEYWIRTVKSQPAER